MATKKRNRAEAGLVKLPYDLNSMRPTTTYSKEMQSRDRAEK